MRPDKPIIESRLDTDFYEFPMGQMIFRHHPNIPVELSFINRTKSIRLAEMIDLGELREKLRAYQTLPFRTGELHYLMGTYEYERPMFRLDYIKFLDGLKKLPDFKISTRDGQLDLRFYGPASEVFYWEEPSMMIVNWLYKQALMKNYLRVEREAVEAEGKVRLARKILELKKDRDITISDFGTRRRHSFEHQDYVVATLKEECPDQFKGTSNVFLAREHEVMPIGTNSHKLPMIYSGIFWDEDNEDPTFSQRQVLKDWEEEYGLGVSIFLSDTWNSDWFFKHVITPDQLRRWKGSRQDSGVPFQYAKKRIRDYERAQIDPSTKLVVFADGLNVVKMRRISSLIKGKIKYTFGWGTDLTNDVGFPLPSNVTKVSRSNGHLIAKLSDNVAKATGDNRAIDRVKKLIGYKETYNVQCKY
jgi:nicotinate phosphoribosyltransferase